jgi:hypothetical protein
LETKTLRTSTILIASEGRTRIFRSRSEMPFELRQKLQRSLNSGTAATILIADQRGRDEILKLLRGEPSALKGAPGSVRRRIRVEAAPTRTGVTLPSWLGKRWVRALIAFLLPAAIGAAFYALLVPGR